MISFLKQVKIAPMLQKFEGPKNMFILTGICELMMVMKVVTQIKINKGKVFILKTKDN